VLIGFAAGMIVCLSVEFVERVLKVDDPGRSNLGARGLRVVGSNVSRSVR